MAPALGLYLGELFFDGYNKKQRQQMENDLRLAKKRAEAKGKVWPPPAAAAPAAVTAPAVADAEAGEESAENPAKRAKLNPAAEGEVAAEGGSGTSTSSSAGAKPTAAEKDDEGQVNIFTIEFTLVDIR